ncbi:MAG: hypothetical protein QM578_12040 [Pantoea sp.]
MRYFSDDKSQDGDVGHKVIDGVLVDEDTKRFLTRQLVAFTEFAGH